MYQPWSFSLGKCLSSFLFKEWALNTAHPLVAVGLGVGVGEYGQWIN